VTATTSASAIPVAAAASKPVDAMAAEVTIDAGPAVDIGERWDRVVRQMLASGSINALVRELAMQAQCVAFHDAVSPIVWRLRVERDMLRSPAQADRLQAALAEALGCPVRLELEAGPAEDSPALRDGAERARRQAEAERTIQDDPLVKALLAQYKTARIVPGSVKPI
jgi:DNA polymerase-3 subunit gamma/tau